MLPVWRGAALVTIVLLAASGVTVADRDAARPLTRMAVLRNEFVRVAEAQIDESGNVADSWARVTLYNALEGLACLGDVDEVTRISEAASALSEYRRRPVKHQLALAHARAGHVAACEQLSTALARYEIRELLRVMIRHAEGEPERLDSAEEAALRIATSRATGSVLAHRLAEIGLALSEVGREDAAQRTLDCAAGVARQLRDIPDAIVACCAIADAFAKLGQPERARALLQCAEERLAARKAGDRDASGKRVPASLLTKLAVSRANCGDRDAALKLAGRAPLRRAFGRPAPSLAWGYVAEALAESGDGTGAAQATMHMDEGDNMWRDSCLAASVRVLSNAGDWETAAGLIEEMGDGSRKAEAQLAMAESCVDHGDTDRAEAIAAEVALRTHARMPASPVTYSLATPSTWTASYDLRDAAGGMVLFAIQRERSMALCIQSARVYHKLKLGDLGKEMPGDLRLMPREYTEVAHALCQTGAREEALAWAMRIQESDSRVAALLGIAQDMAAQAVE